MVRFTAAGAAGLVALCLSMPALAQPQVAGTSGDEEPFAEIVVTAQKRQQLARDVPIALTGIPGSLIAEQNIVDSERLQRFTPGLLVQQQTDSSASFVVRGIEAGNAGAVSEPSISFFLNDVDTSRSRGLSKELFDIDRVEVARGPQGTLFGRGAMVGAIAVYTARPRLADLGWSLEGQVGNYGLVQLTGMLNLPLAEDRLGLRLAVRYRDRDGYVKDLLGGPAFNDDNLVAARGSLRWQPAETITVDLIVDHQGDRDGAVMTKAINVASPGGDTSPFTTGAQNRGEPSQKRLQTGVTLLASLGLGGGFTLQSISGWREVSFEEFFDPDGTIFPFLEARNLADDQRILSQELRVTYDGGKRLRIVFGASYYRDQTKNLLEFIVNEQFLLAGFPRSTTPVTRIQVAPGVFLPVSRGVATSILTANLRESVSVYANIGFDITPRLVIDLGARYTRDDATVRQRNSVFTVDGVRPVALPNGFGNSLGQTFANKGTFELFQPRAALTFRLTDELNLFAGAARGKRAGFPQISFQPPQGGQPRPVFSEVGSETVDNIEIGLKGRPTRDWYLEATLFTLDYKDFQTLSLDFPPRNVNAGKARSRGLELSTTLRLGRAVRLFGNYTLLDTEYLDFRDNVGGQVVDLSGNRFRLAPTHTFTIGGDLRQPIADGWTLIANANYQWRSRYFFNNDNLPTERQPAYGTLDARIGAEGFAGRALIELYAENLTDTEYNRDVGNAGKFFGVPTAIRANPRFWGVRLVLRD